jgi:hypothetical protein
MPVRVGINGFGRTGRATFRAAQESGAAISSGSSCPSRGPSEPAVDQGGGSVVLVQPVEQGLRICSAGRSGRIHFMINAVVTEVRPSSSARRRTLIPWRRSGRG